MENKKQVEWLIEYLISERSRNLIGRALQAEEIPPEFQSYESFREVILDHVNWNAWYELNESQEATDYGNAVAEGILKKLWSVFQYTVK